MLLVKEAIYTNWFIFTTTFWEGYSAVAFDGTNYVFNKSGLGAVELEFKRYDLVEEKLQKTRD